MDDKTPAPRPRKVTSRNGSPKGIAENTNVTPTAAMPALGSIRPDEFHRPQKVDLSKIQEVGELPPLLDKDDEIAHFNTDKITEAMLNKVIAHQLNGGFVRTPAGYMSLKAGLSPEGDVTITAVHWKSFNFPEQDDVVQVTYKPGAILTATAVEVKR